MYSLWKSWQLAEGLITCTFLCPFSHENSLNSEAYILCYKTLLKSRDKPCDYQLKEMALIALLVRAAVYL
jgi:hypothetical protein